MAKARKTFIVRCSTDEATQLAEALGVYAHAAYPPGGSECAQVAREVLQTSAQTIAADAATPTGAELSRRQRSMIKAAVQWYFSDQGPGDVTSLAHMVSLLRAQDES